MVRRVQGKSQVVPPGARLPDVLWNPYIDFCDHLARQRFHHGTCDHQSNIVGLHSRVGAPEKEERNPKAVHMWSLSYHDCCMKGQQTPRLPVSSIYQYIISLAVCVCRVCMMCVTDAYLFFRL